MQPESDDRLLEELANALGPPARPLDPDRILALRAAAEEAQDVGPRAQAAEPARRGFGLRLRFALPAAAAIAAACLALGIVIGDDGGSTSAGGEVEYDGGIALGDASGTLRIADVGIGRDVDLKTDDLPILPKGEFYEVWFVGPGDSVKSPNRISAGTFHPNEDGRSDISLNAAVDPILYPEVIVTAERGNGDPQPSSDVVLQADLG